MNKYMVFYLDEQTQEFLGTIDETKEALIKDASKVQVTLPDFLLCGGTFNALKFSNFYWIAIGEKSLTSLPV